MFYEDVIAEWHTCHRRFEGKTARDNGTSPVYESRSETSVGSSAETFCAKERRFD